MAPVSKQVHNIRFAFRMLSLTDLVITLPTMILIVFNGLFMASSYQGFSNQPEWLKASIYSLFLLWLFVIPILYTQDKMKKLIDNHDTSAVLFKKYTFSWVIIGALSFIPLMGIVYWMVMKSY